MPTAKRHSIPYSLSAIWQGLLVAMLVLIAPQLQARPDSLSVSQAPKQAAIQAMSIALEGRTPSPVEGVWQTDSQGIINIVRTGTDTYDIILYGSDDLSLPLPLTIGSLRHAARPGLYDATIARSISHRGKVSKPTRMAIRVSDKGSWIEFLPYKKGLKVNLRRLLPYLFRFSVQTVDTRPEGLEGARRIYPQPYPTADDPLVL